MKLLKKVLIAIAAFILLILIVAVFTKKSYTIQREVIIHKPVTDVYDYARMNKNQTDYNAWFKMDPNTRSELRGTDGEVGSVWAWESEETGKGYQTIMGLTPNEKIDFEITFIKPFEGKAANTVSFEAIDSTQTKLVSTFSSSMPYPMNIMLLCADMDKMMGTEMQKGLNNMKANLEQ
jgi:hypothetical protein